VNEFDYKYVNLINSWWRPVLAITIVIAVILVYIAYPIVYIICSIKGINIQLPPGFQNALNSLLISGGILAMLRTFEKIKNATQNH